MTCKAIIPCPFGKMCEKMIGYCPGEGSQRYVATGKAILTNIINGEKYYEEDLIDIFTGEHKGRYEDVCANEMFGETDNYCFINPYLIDGKPVVIDWEDTE